MVVSYDVINAKLRKRLEDLQNHANPTEKFRLLKRYLTHFVRFVRYGRLFEDSFADHLQMVVIHLNNRCSLDQDSLATVIKTLCTICCIPVVPYQTVVIALQGLLDIFARISCKEALNGLQRCRLHFQRLISQIKYFKYMKIQIYLVELVYVSSLVYVKTTKRREYVNEFSKFLGDSWMELLEWKSINVAEECRNYLVRLQKSDVKLNVFSVPVKKITIDTYSFTKLSNSRVPLWLDFNFRPATINFSADVSVNHGGDKNEMNVNIEVLHSNVSHIELIDRQIYPVLKISYTAIDLDPKVMDVDKDGSLIIYLLPEFDYNRLRAEVLPSIRMNNDSEENYNPYSLCLDGLHNISLQQTFPSTTAVSVLANSERLQEHRHVIEQHQQIRSQLLNDISSGESNKENEAPNNVANQPHVLLQDVQRLRVFEPLRVDCQRQMSIRAKQSNEQDVESECLKQPSFDTKKLSSKDEVLREIYPEEQQIEKSKENGKHNILRPKHSAKQQQRPSTESSGKKRKLYASEAIEDELNASKDSQIQRNIYVEGKLVNTVKPMKAQEERPIIPAEATIPNESKDPNVSSNITSSEEFQQSLKAYIENNGIFGITQQKILDKKLEKNIRKINQMVDRSARRFFKREPVSENPYDFNEPTSLSKKQKTRKRNNTTIKKGKQNFDNTDHDFVPNSKAAKNKANASRRNQRSIPQRTAKRQVSVPQPLPIKSEPPTQRSSLPRKAKPSVLVDLTSDTEHRDEVNSPTLKNAALQPPEEDTFQEFNISPIESQQLHNQQSLEKHKDFANPKPTISLASTAASKPLNVNAVDQMFGTRTLDDSFEENIDSRNIFVRRNYKKPPRNVLQKMAAPIIEQEKLKAQMQISYSSSSNNSVVGVISIKGLLNETEKQDLPKLTKEHIEQHLLKEKPMPIPQSIELGRNLLQPVPNTLYASHDGVNRTKYDMEYASRNFMLNKYIVENHHVEREIQNEESVLNDEAQVIDPIPEVPPAKDTYRLHSESHDSLSTCYPTTRSATALPNTNHTEPTGRSNIQLGRNSLKRVSCDPETPGPRLKASRVAANDRKTSSAQPAKDPTMLASAMLTKFKEMIHQQLDPALSEMEKKICKLDGVHEVFEQLSTDFHVQEISMKCKEIATLEDKLDQLLDEVTMLCKDSTDRSDHTLRLAKNLVKYDISKRRNYLAQVEIGRQEMPLIVSDCTKEVWNDQIYSRKLQLELLLNKLLM